MFKQINYSNFGNFSEFWKIHVSCQEKDYQIIKNIIKKYCKKYKLIFKFPYNDESFKEINSPGTTTWIYGKIFTIYLIKNDLDYLKKILETLYILLNKFKGPRINTDIRYKNSIIHIRYATYFSDYFIDGSEDRSKNIFYLPNYIKLPYFITFNKKENDIKQLNFLKIISNDNHKTAAVVDFKGKKYFAKIYRKYSNSYDFFYREKETKFSSDFILSPKFYSKVITNDFIVYFWELIHGEDLQFYIEKIESHLKKFQIEKIEIIISCLIKFFINMNKRNIMWTDFRLKNIIFNKNSLYIVDLKHVYRKNDKIKFITEYQEEYNSKVNLNLLIINMLNIFYGTIVKTNKLFFKDKLKLLSSALIFYEFDKIFNSLSKILKKEKLELYSSNINDFLLINIDLEKLKEKLNSYIKISENEKTVFHDKMWYYKKDDYFYPGLKNGSAGILFKKYYTSCNKKNVLQKINQNLNYFNTNKYSIENGLAGFILLELWVSKLLGKKITNRIIYRVNLLKIIKKDKYEEMIKFICN